MNKAQLLFYALKEIGLTQLTDYAIFKTQQKSGILARKTPLFGWKPDLMDDKTEVELPLLARVEAIKPILEKNRKQTLKNADEILAGQFHPFGGEARPLSFAGVPHPARHWCEAGDQVNGVDVKWLWEPARFCWAYDLANAWLLSGDDRYPQCFWQKFKEFKENNPVNSAPNWSSAQEVGIRLMNWLMVFPILREAPSCGEEERRLLTESVWQHAARIPATLGYARSQNNNHLLSESLALMAAGMIFANRSRQARRWLKLGREEFQRGILRQVEEDGTYSQHSANYHRMMLQLCLIFYAYTQKIDVKIPDTFQARIASATRWLTAQLDPVSGRLPNLGHNDGSLVLPMGSAEFRDHRPTAQAASLAFLKRACLPAGEWDLLAAWLGLDTEKELDPQVSSPAVKQLVKGCTRLAMRGVRFHGRPAHADQLHVEVWQDGVNIAQDAGTFCYNCDAPWQNSLASTLVHNTVSMEEREQMVRAGKFLWLRQAQADWIEVGKDRLTASQDGYRREGISHQRTVILEKEDNPQVIDLLEVEIQKESRLVRVHWLLPDWEWRLEGQRLSLKGPDRSVVLTINAESPRKGAFAEINEVNLIKAGKTLAGRRLCPTLGWASDTYGEKHAALSFSVEYAIRSGIKIISDIKLQKEIARR